MLFHIFDKQTFTKKAKIQYITVFIFPYKFCRQFFCVQKSLIHNFSRQLVFMSGFSNWRLHVGLVNVQMSVSCVCKSQRCVVEQCYSVTSWLPGVQSSCMYQFVDLHTVQLQKSWLIGYQAQLQLCHHHGTGSAASGRFV